MTRYGNSRVIHKFHESKCFEYYLSINSWPVYEVQLKNKIRCPGSNTLHNSPKKRFFLTRIKQFIINTNYNTFSLSFPFHLGKILALSTRPFWCYFEKDHIRWEWSTGCSSQNSQEENTWRILNSDFDAGIQARGFSILRTYPFTRTYPTI